MCVKFDDKNDITLCVQKIYTSIKSICEWVWAMEFGLKPRKKLKKRF